MSEYSRRALYLFAVVVVLILAASPGFGGIGNGGAWADRDNTLYEEGTSNGAGEHLFSGRTDFSSVRRALLHFSLADDDVPPGTPVTGASITMQCTKSPALDSTPKTFTLHRVTADWGEAGSNAGNPGGLGASPETGDATWTERFFAQGMPWATPGGDFVATPSASTTIGDCNSAPFTQVVFFSTAEMPQMAEDIQLWIDDPSSNFGWIIIGEEDADLTARRFASKDHELLTAHPILDYVYDIEGHPTPATSPVGAALLVLLLGAASAYALRRRSS